MLGWSHWHGADGRGGSCDSEGNIVFSEGLGFYNSPEYAGLLARQLYLKQPAFTTTKFVMERRAVEY